MSVIECILAFAVLNWLWNSINKKPKREKKMNTDNPYREGYERKEEPEVRKVFDVKGFFEVEDENEERRVFIDSRKVTSITGNEDSTTIYYEAGSEEREYEVTDDYEEVLARFAKARSEV